MNAGNPPRVFGLTPAAGVSRRMGEPKQLMPWAGGTILEAVIATLRHADLDGVAVATNPAVAQALNLDEAGDLAVAIVDGAQTEMIDSIARGVARLRARFNAADVDGFLVVPGDMPNLSAAAVTACAAAYRAAPGRIAVGRLAGKNAHPIVVPFAMAPLLDALHGVGLKGLLTAHGDLVNPVPLADPGAKTDIDSPADYRAARDEQHRT